MDPINAGPLISHPTFAWTIVFIITGFTMFAGLIGSAMRMADQKERFNVWQWLLEGSSAAVIGVIIMLFCVVWGVRWEVTGALCGIAGLTGAKTALRLIQALVMKKINITSEDVRAAKDLQDENNR